MTVTDTYSVVRQADAEQWAAEARAQARLERPYPFSLVVGLSHRGRPLAGEVRHPLMSGEPFEIVMNSQWPSADCFKKTYLHEIAHQIVVEKGMDIDHSGWGHNRYFAVLEAMMYRRAGLLESLKVYDFQDGQGSVVCDDELVKRFGYIIKRSAQLARSSLTVEAAAQWIRRNDYLPTLLPKLTGKEKRPWWAFWS